MRRLGLASLMLAGVIGTIVDSGAASATTRTQKTFGKWLATCIDDDKGGRRCSLTLSQFDPKTRRPIIIVTINGTKEGQNLGLVVPTGISVKDGVSVSFGGGAATTVAYSTCGPRVCYAGVPLDQKLVATLKSQPKGTANYVLPNKKMVQVDVDVTGFTDGYAYLLSQLQ
jgi:invasion protein IalB